MSGDIKEFAADDEMSMEDLIALETDALPTVQASHTIIPAKILAVNKEEVTVDIGLKSEAFIPITEFDEHGVLNVKVGDEIDVFLERREGPDGLPVVSYQKAKHIKQLKTLREKFLYKEPVDITIISEKKGGFAAKIDDIDVFVPASQTPSAYRGKAAVGKTLPALISTFDTKTENIVASPRAYETIEREKQKALIVEKIVPGARLTGVVKTITKYGAFVDVGGMDGLVHIGDIAWHRIQRVEDVLAEGQTVDVVVLAFEKEKGKEKLSLGIKQCTPDPWDTIETKFHAGAVVLGKIVHCLKIGAIVELMHGVEGFIHISNVSWTKKIRTMSDVLKEGDTVRAKVISIDKEKRQISLGLKQVEQSPWEKAKERYHVNSIAKGVVESLSQFGAFVRLEEGVTGLIHIENMSWTRNVRHPKDVLKVGDTVEVAVLEINVETQRIALGLKQKEEDPFKRYEVGQNQKGVVSFVGDNHVGVTLEDGFDGVILRSLSGVKKEDALASAFKKGDEIVAKIAKIDGQKRKLILSVRDYNKEVEQHELDAYLKSNDFSPTFADLLNKKSRNKLKDSLDKLGGEKQENA